MFDYKFPFMEEDSGANGGSIADSQTSEVNSSDVSDEQGVNNTGDADQMSFKNDKQNIAFADMRRKANEADEYKKKLDEYEKKMEKLQKGIPEGFSSLDEYLEALESDFIEAPKPQPPAQPTFDPDKIVETVLSKVKDLPAIKQSEQERRDRFLVENFSAVQGKFTDIKKAEDIPIEVWNAWDEGKSGRTLLSHMKEYRYDNDIEQAKKTGANETKAQAMGVAHTSQVQGTNSGNDYDNVVVPDSVRQQMMRNPLLKKKIEADPNYIKRVYKNYHR